MRDHIACDMEEYGKGQANSRYSGDDDAFHGLLHTARAPPPASPAHSGWRGGRRCGILTSHRGLRCCCWLGCRRLRAVRHLFEHTVERRAVCLGCLTYGPYHVLLLLFGCGQEILRHGYRSQAGLHHFGKELVPKRLRLSTRRIALEGLERLIPLQLILR